MKMNIEQLLKIRNGDKLKFFTDDSQHLIVVFVGWTHPDRNDYYLFKGVVIESKNTEHIVGYYARNFYTHKFKLHEKRN